MPTGNRGVFRNNAASRSLFWISPPELSCDRRSSSRITTECCQCRGRSASSPRCRRRPDLFTFVGIRFSGLGVGKGKKQRGGGVISNSSRHRRVPLRRAEPRRSQIPPSRRGLEFTTVRERSVFSGKSPQGTSNRPKYKRSCSVDSNRNTRGQSKAGRAAARTEPGMWFLCKRSNE